MGFIRATDVHRPIRIIEDQMKKVKGWYFGNTRKILGYGDGRKIEIGTTHTVAGDIIPCQRGLHLSSRIIDALSYGSGPVVYKVEGSGVIIAHGDPVDKYACSKRTYVAGGVDVSDILWKFARNSVKILPFGIFRVPRRRIYTPGLKPIRRNRNK